jgi:hypothetical protein
LVLIGGLSIGALEPGWALGFASEPAPRTLDLRVVEDGTGNAVAGTAVVSEPIGAAASTGIARTD